MACFSERMDAGFGYGISPATGVSTPNIVHGRPLQEFIHLLTILNHSIGKMSSLPGRLPYACGTKTAVPHWLRHGASVFCGESDSIHPNALGTP